jgi:amino acid transporter
MKTERHLKLARQTALLSFLLGTAIFGFYFFTSSFEVLSLVYGFITLAALINSVVLISILVKAKRDKDNREKLFGTCALMLLNIPVLFFYCWTAIILLDTMRITFTNPTPTTLTNINIVGCGGAYIDQLESGESETVWVNITGDCSISIDYLSGGQKKHESVAGYVTSSMGQKMKHTMGGKNEEQF